MDDSAILNPADSSPETPPPDKVEARGRSPLRSALVWSGRALAGLLALVLLAIAFLHTAPGRQFIIDQIAKVAPASGLSVEVGRIEGSVLWSATFYDVKLRDANDTLFLEVPTVDLNWRPFNFITSGLDIRHLVLTGGTLYAVPELIPGDPDAPILPDFDIRVDRLVVDKLTVAKGVLGEERVINLRADADVRSGNVDLNAKGEFGGEDTFAALIKAQPDNDKFDIDVDYNAPKSGFLAAMAGASDDLSLKIKGDGSWTNWQGKILARQGATDLVNLDMFNERGQYRLAGEIRPADYLTGLPADALGEVVEVSARGTLVDSLLDGSVSLRGRGVATSAQGAVDLAGNAFRNLAIEARLLDPVLFGEGFTLQNARLDATLDGGFRELSVLHKLSIGSLDAGGTIVTGLQQQGLMTYDGTRFVVPVNATIARVKSGVEMADPRLKDGRVTGTLVYAGDRLTSNSLRAAFPGLNADLALQADLGSGVIALAGPVNARGLPFDGIGVIDAGARIRLAFGGAPWRLDADFDGRVARITNETLANVAGTNIRFDGAVALGENAPITFRNTRLRASKLALTLDGQVNGTTTTLAGRGAHTEYGAFTVEAELAASGPRAVLVFADPLPAAGLKDVRVALAPAGNGFRIETGGQSMLGRFDGLINLVVPNRGPVMIGIEQLTVAEMLVQGDLALGDGGVSGVLALSRGGIDGTIDLNARDGGQAFDIALSAAKARFGGDAQLAINRGTINANGFIGSAGTTISGNANVQGLSYGSFFIGRLAARADVKNGVGNFDAAIAGRRGSRFELQVNGRAEADRIAVAAKGNFAGENIAMPRRAVLLKTDDGGWQLQKTQLDYGSGFAIAEGRLGGETAPEGKLSLSRLPLSLVDVAAGDLGLGGTISGVVEMGISETGRPIGSAQVMVDNLTRSGLTLTSRPMDLALVADLAPNLFQARAVMNGDGATNGRLQARITGLSSSGGLAARLMDGDLSAQLRYNGPAAALWRLAALNIFDITGPLQVAANVRGTLRQPSVRGSLASDNLRFQSALTGTDLTGVRARGTFAGSRLQLTSFSGQAANGGRVSGSGTIDLANMGRGRGPQIDLRLAANNAEVLDLPGMGATVTGPIRIISNGTGGTVAGRLRVNEARWTLGGAATAEDLPDLVVREINLPADVAPLRAPSAPWRYLINASAPGGIMVDGMGLESEWRGDVRLRGSTSDPRIGGQVEIVPRQGFYSFAGTRFEITRGKIDFDESAAPNPRINIEAETDASGTDITVAVTGTALQPEITFSSVPALPEEELLARLLFGGSITELSATDALQLGAALASLRGGGGMGPINKLRNAIGLDRLRLVPSDPALDRGTSVALGKNISRKFYAEIITDGRGYNATELEFRISSWLSLLASINTLGRGSGSVQVSKDY